MSISNNKIGAFEKLQLENTTLTSELTEWKNTSCSCSDRSLIMTVRAFRDVSEGWLSINNQRNVVDDEMFVKSVIKSLVHLRQGYEGELNNVSIKDVYFKENLWNLIFRCMLKKWEYMDYQEVDGASHIESCNWTRAILFTGSYMHEVSNHIHKELDISKAVTRVLSHALCTEVLYVVYNKNKHQHLDLLNPTGIQLEPQEILWRKDVLMALLV